MLKVNLKKLNEKATEAHLKVTNKGLRAHLKPLLFLVESGFKWFKALSKAFGNLLVSKF